MKKVTKRFVKYVSQNIFGMIGVSAYVLADTFFIALSEGADGITALNLVLPVYSLIFAIGSMIGVGSATKFRIHRARKEAFADEYFTNAVLWGMMIGLLFVLIGIYFPGELVSLLGGDARIVSVGKPYTRIFLLFTPFFIWNYIFGAFVRNDGDPSLAMIATVVSSLFNIVMDYVLMFPLGLGMAGAALATAISPVVGIMICSIHFFTKKNTLRIRRQLPSVRKLFEACQLGISAFVGEISSGVITALFNFLILGIVGNVGVAAYGIVANTAIVATAIFNGIAQGSQPLLSDYYGRAERSAVRSVLKLSVVTAVSFAVLVVIVMTTGCETVVAIFNSEGNRELAVYARDGIRLYFLGYLFAGFNIVGTGYLSATEKAGWAFVTSVLRGFVAIIVCAFVMSDLWQMTGIWLAFPAAELITAVVMMTALKKTI